MRRLPRNDSGATTVEFGLILGVLLLVSVAILEFTLVIFDYSRAAEAARAAARVAVISPAIGNLNNLDTGDVICTSVGGTPSCTGGAVEVAASFDAIVATMRAILPMIAAENVEVSYRFSGIGQFGAGGIKPNVTIRLTNLQRPFMFLDALLGSGASITLPDFSTTHIGNSYRFI